MDVNWNAIGIAVTAAVAIVTSIYILGNSIIDGRASLLKSTIEGTEKQLDARVSRNRDLLKDIGQQLVARITQLETSVIHKDRFEKFALEVFDRLELRATDREIIEVQERISRIEELLFQEAIKGNVPRQQGKIDMPDRLVRR